MSLDHVNKFVSISDKSSLFRVIWSRNTSYLLCTSYQILEITDEIAIEFWPIWNENQIELFLYSCNKITTTWIQISRQNFNQIMIQLSPIVSR